MAEIALVFTHMEWYVRVLLILGSLLVLFELTGLDEFIAAGIGIVMIIAGIITHGIVSRSFVQALFLVLLFTILLILFFVLFIRSARFGFLSKSPIIQNKTSVPIDYSDKRKNVLRALLGQTGVAITKFRPSGKFELNSTIYEGITNGEMLEEGEKVLIVDVEGIKIRVEKAPEKKGKK